MAQIYVMTGEFDAAMDLIEHFMSVPFGLESAATLCSLPWWDPLRDQPRFQALIEKYEKEQEIQVRLQARECVIKLTTTVSQCILPQSVIEFNPPVPT